MVNFHCNRNPQQLKIHFKEMLSYTPHYSFSPEHFPKPVCTRCANDDASFSSGAGKPKLLILEISLLEKHKKPHNLAVTRQYKHRRNVKYSSHLLTWKHLSKKMQHFCELKQTVKKHLTEVLHFQPTVLEGESRRAGTSLILVRGKSEDFLCNLSLPVISFTLCQYFLKNKSHRSLTDM